MSKPLVSLWRSNFSSVKPVFASQGFRQCGVRLFSTDSVSVVLSDTKADHPVRPKQALAHGFRHLPKARYGGRHTVTMLLGDGVSPEMMGHVKNVFHLIGAPVDFEEVVVNEKSDETALQHAILAIQRNGVAIKGSLKTIPGEKSKNIAIRNHLDLFAYVQRCYSLPNFRTRHSDIDVVIIRENTEGEYAQLEHESVPGVVESLKITTRYKSQRIARFAFDYAMKHGRKKVTAVHKANIMKLGDGLFLNTCAEVAKLYPAIEFNSLIIDNCSMQMVSQPKQFDVVLLPNLYGNIVGNIAIGLTGGAGLASGVNLGEDMAVFEAGSRKSARSLVNKNVANPCAMLLAGADLLAYLGFDDLTTHVRDAVIHVTTVDCIRTSDLCGNASTSEVMQAITARLHTQLDAAA